MTRIIWKAPTSGWLLQLEWKMQDFWIGIYWINKPERIDIWICVIPCLPIHYASPVND